MGAAARARPAPANNMAPNMRSAAPPPQLVSLFTGAGGLDIGLEQAGFVTVAANDSAPDCVKTLEAAKAMRIPVPGCFDRTYLGSAEIISGGIEELRPGAFRPRGAGSRWSPDLLVGGPPCQPFSSSGKMLGLADPRGRLFEHFVRIAEGLRPRMILFENVRGLVTMRGPSGTPGETLALVGRSFEEIGYATSFALLNAADFGAPQRRVRLFMIGVRAGTLPDWPQATHAELPDETLFGERKPWVTLAEFLSGRAVPGSDEVIRPSAQLAAQLERLPSGTGLKTPGPREATRPGGHWGYKQGTFIADPNKPARTVTASATQDWVRGSDGTLRRLTWRECAGLQGFPLGWPFHGNTTSRYRQVGNAVPSVFGAVIGDQISRALDSRVRSRPESAAWPASFAEAIRYTSKEGTRNGDSRKRVAEMIAAGGDPTRLRGLGSAEHQRR